MENTAITIKTFYDGDIRRFNLPTRTFARLREVLKDVYTELPSEFVVKYADEEDEFVTIGSDAELAEAIKVANAQGTKALKLYVSGNKSSSIVDLKMPASEPATPKSAPAPAPSAPAATPTAAAAATAAPAAAAAAPATPKVEAKTETKKPSCAELKQLLLEFVQDSKVQAALPGALQAVLNAAVPDQPLSAKALFEAFVKSSSDIANHASVQAVRPFVDEVLPCVQAKLDRLRPEQVQLAKMWAPMLLQALPSLLQALPALVAGWQGDDKFLFDCQQGAAACEGQEQGQAEVLRMLPILLAMAAGGAAGVGGPAGFPFPPPPPPFAAGAGAGAHPPFPFPGFAGPHPHGPFHGRHGHAGHPFFGRGMREFVREQEARATGAAPAAADSASAAAPGLGLSDKADSKGDTKTTAASDVHHGITCDGCKMSPIAGIRYKCTTCSDFDLCESCEAKNIHPAHPLIKIRKEKAPEQPSDVHTNVTCDGCGVVPIKGIRYKCTTCPNYDLCEACEAKNVHPAHPLIKMRVKMPERERGFGFGHHGGHGRFGFGGPHGHGPFGRGRMLHRLFGMGRRGDSPSWRRRDGQEAGAAAAGGAAGAPLGNERPTAEFVKDLTIPDRSETAPQQTLVKTWSVKNNGAVAWPEGAKLIFVRGDREISAQEEFVIPAAKPGETVEINAVIVTPAKKGRYTAFFRLAEKDRVYMFGPRLWIDMFVGEAPAAAEGKADKKQEAPATPKPVPSAPVAPAPAAPATPKPAAAPAPAPAAAQPKPAVPSKWAMQLELLASMGFGNTELNTYLLDRNQGNVQKVAEFLLERMR